MARDTQTAVTAAKVDRDLRALARATATAPATRGVRREYTRRLKSAPPRQVVALAYELIESYERRFVASELIHFHPAAMAGLRTAHLRVSSRP